MLTKGKESRFHLLARWRAIILDLYKGNQEKRKKEEEKMRLALADSEAGRDHGTFYKLLAAGLYCKDNRGAVRCRFEISFKAVSRLDSSLDSVPRMMCDFASLPCCFDGLLPFRIPISPTSCLSAQSWNAVPDRVAWGCSFFFFLLLFLLRHSHTATDDMVHGRRESAQGATKDAFFLLPRRGSCEPASARSQLACVPHCPCSSSTSVPCSSPALDRAVCYYVR
ncbi:hypothetical protein GGR52DRAFT_46251 [Hypoxylon sp. FL1284]|nr:hypothetical protein GGR52DRAFT_46251 [Hypoxylon sp. FL1284]